MVLVRCIMGREDSTGLEPSSASAYLPTKSWDLPATESWDLDWIWVPYMLCADQFLVGLPRSSAAGSPGWEQCTRMAFMVSLNDALLHTLFMSNGSLHSCSLLEEMPYACDQFTIPFRFVTYTCLHGSFKFVADDCSRHALCMAWAIQAKNI